MSSTDTTPDPQPSGETGGYSVAYVPPPKLLLAAIRTNERDETVTMPREVFRMFLRELMAANGFDANWYRSTYQDVDRSIRSGRTPDELSHFVTSGYREARLPQNFEVDEKWYLEKYPDVLAAIKAGTFKSGQDHYLRSGYFEGRFASPAVEASGAKWLEAINSAKRPTPRR